MTEKPMTVRPDDRLLTAARRMLEWKIKRLPVVDAEGELVGIVSRRDLLRGYARPDDEIAVDVHQVLRNPRHVPENVAVERMTVRDGVVEFHGWVEFPTDIPVVEAAVRSVPGVVDVNIHLFAREPEPRLRGPLVPPIP